MAELEIKNLHVTAADKQILKGVDLHVRPGEFHALMGPNGSGKSTLANAIMGHPNLEVTDGQIIFKGEDMTEADPDERARAGLFMAFQYPVAVPGVTVTQPTQTNGVFAVLPAAAAEHARKTFRFYDWRSERGEVRLMCAFDTTEEDVDRLVKELMTQDPDV